MLWTTILSVLLTISSLHLYSVHCSGLVHWSLLASLDVENLILVLTLVLLEQKVVFHSGRPALLTFGYKCYELVGVCRGRAGACTYHMCIYVRVCVHVCVCKCIICTYLCL